MRSVLISALCWGVQLGLVAASHVHTYDPQSERWGAFWSMTPVQARLVLAQRAGVEDHHSADLLGDGVVECIKDKLKHCKVDHVVMDKP